MAAFKRFWVWSSLAVGREVHVLTEKYRQNYNRIRPHSSLGYRPPAPQVVLAADMVLALVELT